jgi:pimeloyl-ACP methyl ester carboxylesterase/membrane protease YdiL (CAAX protease family)
MRTLTAFITKHPVAIYFALTFTISWGGALLAIGGGGGMRGTTPASDPRFAYALIAMLAGPSVTGILLTWLVSGRTGLRKFLARLLAWRVGARWYAVALLTAPILMTATLLGLSSTSPSFLPGIFTSEDKGSLLLISLAVGLSAGLFEELGWTGFAIPTLRSRYGVLATGLIVGTFWSGWHLLPNVWSSRAASGELTMSVYLAATAVGIFVGYLTAFRVLMVWVYELTESLLLGMLMHVSFTASLLTLNPLNLVGRNLQLYSFALAGMLWVVVAAFHVSLRYRQDLSAGRARLAAVERHVISTQWGALEYAERGDGDPVLVVHGIYHNCVGGLLSVRDLCPDRRVIAPSRFGYLGSSMPPNATPAAQADAFAVLLDALDIDQIDVIGLSAGATSALQLALRHPRRVKHLVVLVGNLPGSPTAVVQPSWAKLQRQFVMWALRTFAPSTMVRMVAAVPKEFAMTSEDARFVTDFIDSLFPVSAEGFIFDAFISNADVNDYNLEAISVRTLIAHTKDDQLASHEASQRAAERIPGARFVSLESGGHLMIGQTKIIRDELADFFAERKDRRADRVAS